MCACVCVRACVREAVASAIGRSVKWQNMPSHEIKTNRQRRWQVYYSRDTTVRVFPYQGLIERRQHCLIYTRTICLQTYTHTHTHSLRGRFYLTTMTCVCTVRSFPFLTHTLCWKHANESTELAHTVPFSFVFYLTWHSPSTQFVTDERFTSVQLHASAIRSQYKQWQASVYCTSLGCHKEAAWCSVNGQPRTTNAGGGAVMTTLFKRHSFPHPLSFAQLYL